MSFDGPVGAKIVHNVWKVGTEVRQQILGGDL